MKTIFLASKLFTPTESVEKAIVIVEDGRIVEVTSRDQSEVTITGKVVDLGDKILVPGFLDIHIHGNGGHDIMEATPDALAAVERSLAKHGVTSYLPTTVTAAVDRTVDSLQKLADAIEGTHPSWDRSDRAVPLGLHLEGPFISHAKKGVHPPEYIQEPSIELFEKFWNAARGHVKVMTVAPETKNAPAMIADATEKGVCVSLGHSNATCEETEAGIKAGGRHATHTFNAMRTLDHHEPGILGTTLSNSRMTAEIIADGIHVHPDMVRLFVRAKGLDHAVLITDGISATGMGDGRFMLGSFEVEVKGERAEANGVLAGSVLTLDRAVRNVMKFAGCKLQEAVRLATLNPARVIGVSDRKGKIAPGADADFAVLTSSGEVVRTILAGRV
ncbi:MAG TPA: N-acetylglucosamine-6-phosphate deacetylase [Terriglobales bacterium]|nr:N-acetylglucosamine-6-phosphate deacetylase [Terriglobales bacterium]